MVLAVTNQTGEPRPVGMAGHDAVQIVIPQPNPKTYVQYGAKIIVSPPGTLEHFLNKENLTT